MLVRWHAFESGQFKTEAQLFLNESGCAGKVILFCPGFPGMGATLFEQRHAAALVEHGYDVAVLKHKGIRLDSPTAPVMVNNAARLMQGRANKEVHIGGGVATIDDWLSEPVAALKALSGQYRHIDVIGNSFGALSALWSLTQEGVDSSNVKSLLLYAGAQGMAESIMRIWKPEYIKVPRIADKVGLEDAERIVARLKTVYETLPGRVRAGFPQHIALRYLVVERDELLKLEDTEDFRAAIDGRGEISMDSVSHPWPDYGLMAHDTPDYKTEELLKLI